MSPVGAAGLVDADDLEGVSAADISSGRSCGLRVGWWRRERSTRQPSGSEGREVRRTRGGSETADAVRARARRRARVGPRGVVATRRYRSAVP